VLYWAAEATMAMSEGPNPFEPPKSAWERGETAAFAVDDFIDAGLGVRFANLMLDSVCRVFLMFVYIWAFGENLWVTIFIAPAYYLVFEALFARTPAKWITRTRVIGPDGTRPTFLQILGRSLARFVPFEPFSFFGNNRGWHDRWSNTRVVRTDRSARGRPIDDDD
jgi:uncharacterized RDD family membrane protein YckC